MDFPQQIEGIAKLNRKMLKRKMYEIFFSS